MTQPLANAQPQAAAMAPGAEKRAAPRVALFMPARIVMSDLTASCNVMIEDVSPTGARVRLFEDRELTRYTYLLVHLHGRTAVSRITCATRWQVAGAAGLRFEPGEANDEIVQAMLDRALSGPGS